MEIKHQKNERGGEFLIEKDGNRAAEMTYTNAGGDRISFDHTFVEKHLRKSGVGRDLVAAGIAYARANNLKVVAHCPFAKAVIERNTEFQDVSAE